MTKDNWIIKTKLTKEQVGIITFSLKNTKIIPSQDGSHIRSINPEDSVVVLDIRRELKKGKEEKTVEGNKTTSYKDCEVEFGTESKAMILKFVKEIKRTVDELEEVEELKDILK